MKGKLLLLLMSGMLLNGNVADAAPVGSVFSYQGQLQRNGQPATNGVYGLRFSLYDAASTPPGALVGTASEQLVPVTNSIFTVLLDFGAGAFSADARWLEISVNTNTVSPTLDYLALTPRTRITPTPNAIYASRAGTVTNGAIQVDHLAAGTPTAGQLLGYNGSLLVWQDTPALSGAWVAGGNNAVAGNFLGTLNNLPLELKANNARALLLQPTATSPNLIGGWGGNSVQPGVSGATISGGGAALQFGLGASNLVTDHFGVVGGGAHNLAGNFNSDFSDAWFASVGGGHFNSARGTSSTIAGGANNEAHGVNSAIGGGYLNKVLSDYGTITGGGGNTIDTNAYESTIAGGSQNTVKSLRSVVSGGLRNVVGPNSVLSTIAGGRDNLIQPDAGGSVIGGGTDNIIDELSILSIIAGGWVNRIQTNSESSTIAGGQGNRVQNNSSIATISGGYYNIIGSNCAGATISGGDANTLGDNSADATMGGGYHNAIRPGSPNATLSGGMSNTVAAENATIAGGFRNTIEGAAFESTIGGGGNNSILAFAVRSTVSGGNENVIQDAANAAISGGFANRIERNATSSTIGGGYGNTIQPGAGGSTIGGGVRNAIQQAFSSTIAGGNNNAVRYGGYATIAGGRENVAGDAVTSTGDYSSVGGGQLNNAQGNYATVPGGVLNWAPGDFSFAAGRRAKAFDAGSFVWADSTDADFGYGGANKFQVRASGGVLFYGNPAGNVGVYLAPGGNSWAPTSDRNAKENFREINRREVLAKLVALPILNYNLKSQTNTIRHLGPMAQDFYAAFQLGEDNKHITTIDADGVALAAIQGMYEIVREQQKLLEQRAAENTQLQQEVAALQKQVALHTQTLDRWGSRFLALEKAMARHTNSAEPISITSLETGD